MAEAGSAVEADLAAPEVLEEDEAAAIFLLNCLGGATL